MSNVKINRVLLSAPIGKKRLIKHELAVHCQVFFHVVLKGGAVLKK